MLLDAAPPPDPERTRRLKLAREKIRRAVETAIAAASFTLSPDQVLAVVRIVSIIYLNSLGLADPKLIHPAPPGMFRDYNEEDDDAETPHGGYLTLAGPAGSGKTTIERVIVEALAELRIDVRMSAPTGKAAARMRQVFPDQVVMTIHGLIYGSPTEVGICPACKAESPLLAKAVGELKALGQRRQCGACKVIHADDAPIALQLRFASREAQLERDEIWMVDEASMVTADQHRDLLACGHGGLILYIGDPNQLPPVEEKEDAARPHPNFADATARLSRVHRQGEGSGVLDAAQAVLNGVTDGLLKWKGRHDVIIHRKSAAMLAEATAKAVESNADQITLVGSNKLRMRLNELVRDRLAHRLPLIDRTTVRRGARYQCRLNNHGMGVMNGEVLTVIDAAPVELNPNFVEVRADGLGGGVEWFYLVPQAINGDVRDYRYLLKDVFKQFDLASDRWLEGRGGDNLDDDIGVSGIADGRPVGAFEAYLQRERILDARRFLHVHDGYAITTHSSQGSQWQRVLYAWDSYVWAMSYRGDLKPHLYTGITRAQKVIEIYVIPKESA